MTRWLLAVMFAVLLPVAGTAQRTGVAVVSGTMADGTATELWRAMLRKRLDPGEYAAVAEARRVLTPEEGAWAQLIHAHAATWPEMVVPLAVLYAPEVAPALVTIVIGNRGGGDAFTHDAQTIGFDLSELQHAYGNAGAPGNAALIDRFFRHEFMHVLQKPWLETHPFAADTPLRRALLDMWAEALGNFFSLSDRWVGDDGKPTARAADLLAAQEPRLVARLSALACARPEAVPALLAGLSSGPFDRKWGAVPPALWIAMDGGARNTTLRTLIAAGPNRIWDLAYQHLPERVGAVLREAQVADSICARLAH